MALVSVVLPTYNEAGNIRKLVTSILKVFQDSGIGGEIVIVDDNSPDGTGRIADDLSKNSSNVVVLHRKSKLGIGSAYLSGVRKSRGEVVITMDADFSHDPKEIPNLVHSIESGADMAIGSRYVSRGRIENWGVYRRLVSKTANGLTRLFLGVKARDVTTGYRAFRRNVFEELFYGVKNSGYSFLMECVFRAESKGYRISEIPIVFSDRTLGKSKLGKKEQVNFALTVGRLAFSRLRGS